MECGICYSYQLGDAVPGVSCEDPKCNQPFHHACLYEVCDVACLHVVSVAIYILYCRYFYKLFLGN